PLLASAAHTTASSLSAVMTAPSTASGMPSSGAVTRNFSASSVLCIRLERISSGLPTRGRRGHARCLDLAVGQRSVALARTAGALVLLERGGRRAQRVGRHPQLLRR